MGHQLVLVLDFGGQYNQLIARRVRDLGVYCEVKPYTTPLDELKAMEPIGLIFTGGPNSVYEASAPRVDPAVFELGIPVLGTLLGQVVPLGDWWFGEMGLVFLFAVAMSNLEALMSKK